MALNLFIFKFDSKHHEFVFYCGKCRDVVNSRLQAGTTTVSRHGSISMENEYEILFKDIKQNFETNTDKFFD